MELLFVTSITPIQQSPPIDTAETTDTRSLLTLSTEWLDAKRVRITAAGEIDAENLAELPEYVFRRAANSRTLVLDLREVKFFAIDAFHALQVIVTRCEQAEVDLKMVPSKPVSRVLELCDPNWTFASPAA